MTISVFYTHDIFSSQRYGGITRYFQELTAALPHLPDAPRTKVFTGLSISSAHGESYHGLQVPQLPHTRFLRHAINERWQTLCIDSFRPDLIHVTYPTRTPRDFGAPIIFTVHDMIPELFPDQFGSQITSSALKREYCKLATRVIAVSSQTKSDLVRIFQIEPEKIDVIHHGVRFPLKKSEPFSFGRPYFLYVGTQEKYKNFGRLLEAFLGSPLLRENYGLAVIGTQEPDLRGVEGAVRFFRGPDSLLHSLYAGATALVYPSEYEGFGMPLLEAMAHGCPVLSSDCAALRETAGDSAAYFFAGSVGSIRKVMEESAQDPQTLKLLAARGLDRARSFSWDECARKTLHCYMHAMA